MRKLAYTQLLDHFPKSIFSAHMVRQGKPAPDLFLHAAKTMNWNPQSCIVVEDSEPGVRAALAAGMQVLGFTGGRHIQPGHEEKLKMLGCSEIFSDMKDLPRIISRL